MQIKKGSLKGEKISAYKPVVDELKGKFRKADTESAVENSHDAQKPEADALMHDTKEVSVSREDRARALWKKVRAKNEGILPSCDEIRINEEETMLNPQRRRFSPVTRELHNIFREANEEQSTAIADKSSTGGEYVPQANSKNIATAASKEELFKSAAEELRSMFKENNTEKSTKPEAELGGNDLVPGTTLESPMVSMAVNVQQAGRSL